MRTKWTVLRDDGRDDTWRSEKFNNGDFDYWLILKIRYLPEYMGDDAPAKYSVSLSALSITEAGPEGLKSAMDSWCMENHDPAEIDNDMKIEILDDYGIGAPLWDKTGNNRRKLKGEAQKEAEAVQVLFGFYMDRPVNRIGSTGWDFIKGDITAGLRA